MTGERLRIEKGSELWGMEERTGSQNQQETFSDGQPCDSPHPYRQRGSQCCAVTLGPASRARIVGTGELPHLTCRGRH